MHMYRFMGLRLLLLLKSINCCQLSFWAWLSDTFNSHPARYNLCSEIIKYWWCRILSARSHIWLLKPVVMELSRRTIGLTMAHISWWVFDTAPHKLTCTNLICLFSSIVSFNNTRMNLRSKFWTNLHQQEPQDWVAEAKFWQIWWTVYKSLLLLSSCD